MKRKTWRYVGIALVTMGLLTVALRMDQPQQKSLEIGIIQLIEQEPLDKVRTGFIDKLQQEGYQEGKNLHIRYRNANGDQANLTSIAQQFIGRHTLNLAITTVAAQAMLQSDQQTPLIFSPITDPKQAKLVKAWDHPQTNATGTSDQVPMDQLLNHFQAAFPKMRRLGMIYNASEANSKGQFERLKEEGAKRGLSVVGQTIANTNDVATAIKSLALKVDGMVLPTDNTITSAIPIIAATVKETNIPVMGSDAAQLEACVATYGVDYYTLGRQAGRMATQILRGQKSPNDLPVETAKRFELTLNPAFAEQLHVTQADFEEGK
ncbi:MAG: ABC transporter substrate-binding protein [Aerococcus sp.]|nr:ABC transporter substrate-binding protein [Aerococcus sp.]